MLKQIFALQYSKIKLAVLALLIANILIYAVADTLVSSMDALAWVALLLMYEFEASEGPASLTNRTLHSIRNLLIVVIALVFFYYVHSNEWLDVINAILWFALIALLELEIRYPQTVAAYQRLFWVSNIFVFFGLLVMVMVWLSQAAWLDAYDAALWIVAFALIEVDIFHFLQLKKN